MIPADIGLYVHLPWCVSKCPYCDFNSHRLHGELPQQPYVDALLEDLDHELDLLGARRVTSVFIGGGTPSLFSGEAIARLLAGIRARAELDQASEITLEANPSSADRRHFAAYREAGVNRLSIGAQSFAGDLLARLGRAHGPGEIVYAVQAARAAGFEDFNLDVMFGLPGQSIEQALADIDAALSLAPTHLSHYQLTLEPNTRFFAHPPPLPDDDTLWCMQERCGQRLRGAGFERYEVSAWALPAKRCRHNLNYWRFGDYLGIGAGAHGKVTTAEGMLRREKLAHPRAYLAAPSAAARVARTRSLDAADARFEFLLNALRLVEGFTGDQLTAALGGDACTLVPELEAAAARGLLEQREARWRATERGFRFLDSVLLAFLPEREGAAGARR